MLRSSKFAHEKPRKRLGLQSLLRNRVQKVKTILLALTRHTGKYAPTQHGGYSEMLFNKKHDAALVVQEPTDPSRNLSAILGELYSLPGSEGQSYSGRILELIRLLEPLFPLPPETDNGTHSHLYKRLLELSRYGSGEIPQKALRLLLIQVGTGDSRNLSKVITQRCSSNVRHILAGMVGFLRDSCTPAPCGPLQPVWRHYGFLAEHSLTPFIRFINQIAQYRRGAAEAALGAGFLELLECMCTSNFLDPRIPTADTSSWLANTALISACILTLSTLINRCGDHPTLITKLPALSEIWPTSRLYDLTRIASPVLSLTMDDHHSTKLEQVTKQAPPANPCDLCAELLQLSESKARLSVVIDGAIPIFLASLSVSANEPNVWVDLKLTLLQAPYDAVVNLFFNIIKYLVRSFPLFGTPDPFVQPFMEFTDILTQNYIVPRVALVEAGILSLKYPYSFVDSPQYWSRFAYLSPILLYSRKSVMLDLERSRTPGSHHTLYLTHDSDMQ